MSRGIRDRVQVLICECSSISGRVTAYGKLIFSIMLVCPPNLKYCYFSIHVLTGSSVDALQQCHIDQVDGMELP